MINIRPVTKSNSFEFVNFFKNIFFNGLQIPSQFILKNAVLVSDILILSSSTAADTAERLQ